MRSHGSRIRDPIIVLGTGRCGTTALHQLLAGHPGVGWLSSLANRYPGRPELNRLAMQSLDFPLSARLAERRLLPVEKYAFWDSYYPGFSVPCRNLSDRDLLVHAQRRLESYFSQCTTARRSRLLLKITGWPRVGFLARLFPDARFIYVLRDGRAVAHSLLNVDWWHGWGGPQRWRWGLLSNEREQVWTRLDRSFAVLAGIQWELLIEAWEEDSRLLAPDRLLVVRFEDICARKTEVLRRIMEFSHLAESKQFGRRIERFKMINTNDKWQRELSPREQAALQEAIGNTLGRYGYA